MSNKTNPGQSPSKRKIQLDTIFLQLTSQRPSEAWRGTDELRKLLKADINDREAYGILLDAVQQNPALRDNARTILLEMVQLKSDAATEALTRFPTFIPDIMTEADDAYYAGEYSKAIQLYQQVLRLEPENKNAKEHLAKAILKQENSEQPADLPRSAKQFYWRARSYLAAKQTITAINLLNAAIEAAQAKGVPFPEAEEYLISVQKISLAEEHIKKAKNAISNGRRRNALVELKIAKELDPTNRDIQNQIWQQNLALSLSWLVPISMLIFGWLVYYYIFQFPPNTPTPASSATFTLTPELAVSDTPVMQITATSPSTASLPSETATVALLPIDTIAPTITPTETISPTPQEVILGRGLINKAVVSVWKDPNKNKIATLGLDQPVTLLELKFVSGSNWYRCRWDNNGLPAEGWILAEYITLSP